MKFINLHKIEYRIPLTIEEELARTISNPIQERQNSAALK